MIHSNQVAHLCPNVTPCLLRIPPVAGVASSFSSTLLTSPGPSRPKSNSSHHQMETPSTGFCKAVNHTFCELSMLLPLARSVTNPFTRRGAFQCTIRDTMQHRQLVGQWEPGRLQSENWFMTLPSLLSNTSCHIALPAPWRPLELVPDL